MYAGISGAVILVGILSVLSYCVKRFHSSLFSQSLKTLFKPDIFIITGRSNRQSQIEIEENVEMQRCGAYQVVRLSRQRVTMKDNPAYVDVNIRTLA